jgi:hypothetical protein
MPTISIAWHPSTSPSSHIHVADNTVVICDGHDTHGALLSRHAAELLGATATAADPETLFRDTDRSLRDRLLAVSSRYRCGPAGVVYDCDTPILGGTTASLLRIDPVDGTIHFAHVGDSEGRYWDFQEDADTVTATLCAPERHRILGDFHRKPEHSTATPTCQSIAPTASVRRRVVIVASRAFWNRVILPELTALIVDAGPDPDAILARLRPATAIAIIHVCW